MITDPLLAPLFQPMKLRGLTIPNRLTMAPMTRSFSPGNAPDAAVVDYYRKRAEGGTGLIVTEGVGIDQPAAIGGQRNRNPHPVASRRSGPRRMAQRHRCST
jgi:2,4-dienoyl-CoA reductase-like NADH-dependent reductase (Old Yellow Enzyme family)